MLLTITTSDVLIGILETKDPNWNVQARIVNCHTGLAVGETTFPQGALLLDRMNGRPVTITAHGSKQNKKKLWL